MVDDIISVAFDESKLPHRKREEDTFGESGFSGMEPDVPAWEDGQQKPGFVLRDDADFYGGGKPWTWRVV